MIQNVKNFRKIIDELYPNISTDRIQIFDDGWDYVVFAIDGRKAVRFPRRPDYAEKLPVEVAFLNHFSSQSPVSVPRLTLHTDKQTSLPYVTYDFIPGVQFKKSVSRNFSKVELSAVAKQLGEFLTAMHSFPVETAKQLGIQQIDSFESWEKRLTKIKKEVFPHISEYEQKWTVTLFKNFLEIIAKTPVKPLVTHSDIMPEHIIVDPETHTLSGIIDFGDILIADPAYDFTFLAGYGKDFLNECYRNYGLPRDEMFEKRRQFYEDRLALTNLEHSIEQKDQIMIGNHKAELNKYVFRPTSFSS